MNVSVIVAVPSEQAFFSQGPCRVAEGGGVGVGGWRGGWALASSATGERERARLGCRRSEQRGGSGSGRARAPRPAPRVQPPGVCARRARRRASEPARAHAAARGPGGGRGRARPREGKGPVLPAQAAAAAAQEAEAAAAAACPLQWPGRVGPAPAPAPRRGALSTARGEYLPPRPPRPPAGIRRAGVDAGTSPCASLPHPPSGGASAAVGALGGARAGSGRPGLPGRLRHKGSGHSGQILSGESPSRARGLSFPVRLAGNDPEVCTPARGTSAWRAGGVDAAGSSAFGLFYDPSGSR